MKPTAPRCRSRIPRRGTCSTRGSRRPMAEIRYIDAINQAHYAELARDARVLFRGEDVGRKGGVFGATMGLVEKFGEDRVIDTPLAGSWIAGVAIGIGANRLLPIAECQ